MKTKNNLFMLLMALLLAISPMLSPAQSAQAATCTVTSDADSGAGTLRTLLADTNCNAIGFNADYIVRLASELEITRDVSIDGANRTVSISGDSDNNGSNDVRLFSIASGVTLTLQNLTLKRANGTDGGAIANSGTLIVVNSTFSSNTASGNGGAIANSGTLTVTGSTFISNTAAQAGGAISNGRYVDTGNYYYGTATVTNSTFTGNSALEGGAINNLSTIMLVNNTIVDNTANDGAGSAISNFFGLATIKNTLFMNNYPEQYTCSGGFSGGSWDGSTNNLYDYTGIGGDCPAEQAAEETFLISSLGNYGSSTKTFALLPGSIAIDRGSSADCSAADQRGMQRVGACDIGAYEAQGFVLEPLTGATPQTVFIGAAFAPLAVAVNPVNSGDPVDGGKVIYVAPTPSSGATVRTIMDYAITEEYHQVTQTISGGISSVPAVANMTLGTYDVVASTNGATDIKFRLTHTCIAGPKTVTNANDSGPGSLRQGIDSSCTGGATLITFDKDLTIHLATPLELNREYTIDGAGHKVTISGNHVTRVFNIRYFDTVLQNLTVANGANNLDYGGGAGIFFRGFDFTKGSHATLTLTNMTFSGNRGGQFGGAIFAEDHVVVTNATFAGNEAVYGSSIYATDSDADITVTNSTFKDNAGAASIYYGENTLTINNSILANGRITADGTEGSSNCGLNLWNPIQGSHNLADDFTCNGLSWNIDIAESYYPYLPLEEQYPHTSFLGTLGDNGGSTQTVPLLEGSPAIDAGDGTLCPATDQRGVTRPQGIACDIGAYEYQVMLDTATTLSSLANLVMEYMPITFTATISPVPDGGTVAFKDEGVVISGCGAQTVTDGQATCTTAMQSRVHFITAAYSGYGIYKPSLSPVFLQGVAIASSDRTPPVITPDIQGVLGQDSWYTSEVILTWVVADSQSVVTTRSGCDPVSITSDQQVTVYTCKATSAGGTGSVTVSIKRDATAPTLSPVITPDPVLLNGSATAYPNASDAFSGMASAACDPVITSSVGLHTLTCSAEDNAGNPAAASASYTVKYDSVGFSSPVDTNGVLNIAKAGQMIPLKWRLLDSAGAPITTLDPASVTMMVSPYACPSSVVVDAIETYTSGTTVLQNLGNGYYQLNWKTDKAYVNTCKQITLKIDTWTGDGFNALFQFKK